MCGIIGSIEYSKNLDVNNYDWIKSKIKLLNHRGPDEEKVWISENKNIIFGHTKLSIIDLSKDNTQPMIDDNQNIILIFNGEIYNYLELKDELKNNYNFKTDSDTEVIIKSYIKWGEKFLEKIEGMFALALFDKRDNNIFIGRDRLGEKPLFYKSNKNEFIFSSELRIFNDNAKLNKKVLNETLLNGFPINKSETIFENIYQVEPGENIKINLNSKVLSKNKYWKLNLKTVENSLTREKEFDIILNKSIEKCLRSDVKSCITLSGGLDSSLITAIASKQKKIDTFSVIFKNKKFDERAHISKISNEFKTNHHEIEIDKYTVDEMIDIIKKFDLPILDSSTIPSYLLFKNLFKNGYKVAIGGDGGDEIFGGYNHYKIYKKIANFKKKFLNINFPYLSFLSNKFGNNNFKGSQYLFYLLNSRQIYKIPYFLLKNLREKIVKPEFFLDVNLLSFKDDKLDLFRQSQFIDINYTLPLSLLNKLDRCSMLNSVESRSPFLSKEIIEFSMTQLDSFDLVTEKKQKIFLKEVAKKYLPKDFVYERKQGFSFPLIDIIKKPEEVKKIEKILTSKDSIFNKDHVSSIIEKSVNSKIRVEILFCLLSVQIWISNNIKA